MGNFFTKQKQIICMECQEQGIDPEYFTKHQLNNKNDIFVERIEKYDAYGNIINGNIDKEKTQFQYTCSNNHKFIIDKNKNNNQE